MPIIWPIAAAAGGVLALDRLAHVTARPPKRPLERTAVDLGVPHEMIEFEAFDGITLRGEWIEHLGTDRDRPVVVLVHGWTGNSGTMLYVARPLLEAGYPVFTFDVRHHGRSDDAPYVTIRHFRDDLAHAVRLVRERRPGAPVLVAGHSLGGSAALLLGAAGAPVDGVILIAAPADLMEVTAGMFSDRGLPGGLLTGALRPFWQRRAGVPFRDLDPAAGARRLGLPLLVVHGDRDARVPAEHAMRLAENAGTEVLWIEGAEHKDILDRPELHEAMVAFVGAAARESATIDVLAAVIRREDRFLVCRRPAGKRHAGLWEFPGGKIAPGESRQDAAARELREELDLELLHSVESRYSFRDPDSPFVIHFMEVEAGGTPRPTEHEEIRWVAGPDLLDLPLAPADRAFAEWLTQD
ncbi:MAG: alpha/beta fold hydrolase [marine benthic group bacterium]|jgi:8-oxo-dGTP diphosphatase|nr:alpha/beta fold hydrolase [Gemmatimonadota bacterium]MCL7962274.1 alpha/beta fold hydrolase [Candidatus Carthagonibacter metallireducens]MCL7937730.1 alpha/beta fold hydrolase [Gemmatimonadota bacterium]MCL7956504.1 alpha/beta fold hydrolase [Gemmatimonadota bacterium]MCL7965945.1 alpha/beta fold hydrolase [Gemmatimonadota bacterium]